MLDRQQTNPITYNRSLRRHATDVITSFKAGKVVPLAYVPLLREDAVRSGSFRFDLEMLETAELLVNAVQYRIQAWLVPNLAFDRFEGLDDLNRAYQGLGVVPYFESVTPATINGEITNAMGIHLPTGNVNTNLIESYNQIWNYRARNRARSLTPRARLATTLAPAFWEHLRFSEVVPSFDQKMIDGNVPLVLASTKAPVKGIGIDNPTAAGTHNIRETGATAPVSMTGWYANSGTHIASIQVRQGALAGYPDIYAEMAGMGISMSLSTIDLAKKTSAFAKLRTQYEGIDDEYIIDMLMDGLTVPEQALRQPMLLKEENGIFGMSKRYATDAANLTQNVVNGMTSVEMRIRTPRIDTGGQILFTIEVLPEQLFERQADPYLAALVPNDLPQTLRDALNVQQVDYLKNGEVDVVHATPAGIFGYVPLNHKWTNFPARVGGKFTRIVGDAFLEARQRIWAVEAVNPTLNADFYVANTIHQKVFEFTTGDNFEAVMRGVAEIDGLTVFGPPLIEGTGVYQDVLDENTSVPVE